MMGHLSERDMLLCGPYKRRRWKADRPPPWLPGLQGKEGQLLLKSRGIPPTFTTVPSTAKHIQKGVALVPDQASVTYHQYGCGDLTTCHNQLGIHILPVVFNHLYQDDHLMPQDTTHTTDQPTSQSIILSYIFTCSDLEYFTIYVFLISVALHRTPDIPWGTCKLESVIHRGQVTLSTPILCALSWIIYVISRHSENISMTHFWEVRCTCDKTQQDCCMIASDKRRINRTCCDVICDSSTKGIYSPKEGHRHPLKDCSFKNVNCDNACDMSTTKSSTSFCDRSFNTPKLRPTRLVPQTGHLNSSNSRTSRAIPRTKPCQTPVKYLDYIHMLSIMVVSVGTVFPALVILCRSVFLVHRSVFVSATSASRNFSSLFRLLLLICLVSFSGASTTTAPLNGQTDLMTTSAKLEDSAANATAANTVAAANVTEVVNEFVTDDTSTELLTTAQPSITTDGITQPDLTTNETYVTDTMTTNSEMTDQSPSTTYADITTEYFSVTQELLTSEPSNPTDYITDSTTESVVSTDTTEFSVITEATTIPVDITDSDSTTQQLNYTTDVTEQITD